MIPIKTECDDFNICRNFLVEMDNYCANNLNNLTCCDIFDIYASFFQDLKIYKGNSNGFTGLSEYLIFRYIYHLLGGSFERVQIKDSYKFKSKDEKCIIGENLPVKIGSKEYRPDIVIYRNDKLILAIEIKLYLTSGLESLVRDLEKLKLIHKHHPSAKGIFISYSPIAKNGKIYEKLLEEANSNDWLGYIILAKNEELFKEKIEKYLK